MPRIAIIGAGIFVRETYIPNLLANTGNNVKFTAILSRSKPSVDESLALLNNENDEIKTFIGSEGEEVNVIFGKCI